MDPRFFGNSHWYQQPEPTRPSRPVHVTGQSIQHPARKVVQIPVHFVGSGPVDRSGSAMKIQKVFRGFLVRKSLNKIWDIKAEVDEIEEKLQRNEVVELIRSDKKEQLRMNETLMSLLLKLDSICGLDFGVRLCRKAVIRKAIALQDRIDAVVAVDQETQISVCSETGVSNQDDLSVRSDDISGNLVGSVECSEALMEPICVGGEHLHENARNLEDPIKCSETVMDDSGVSEGRNEEESEIIDVGVDVEFKVDDDENHLETKDKGKPENSGCEDAREQCCDGSETEEVWKKGENQNKRNRGLLERMMDDNEKMMKMMEQLCERTEAQTRKLNALTHRVELLENAFLCDRLTRNKKNKAAAARRPL